MADILDFPGNTKGLIPVERIPNHAMKQDLEDVVVVGFQKDGDLFLATSSGYKPDILYLLELAKQETMAWE